MKLFSREMGQGKPLIIMHGVFGMSDNWLTVAKDLSTDYNLHLLDLRNHGQSPHSEDFSYEEMAADLEEYLTDHQLVNPYILGHSMGGKVAMTFASAYNNYAKLIIADISPRFYRRHHDDILNGMKSLNLQELKTRQEADIKLSESIPDLAVRQFILKNLYRDQDNHFAWRINLRVIDSKIDAVGEALPPDTIIEKPTLFIKGGNSHYIEQKDEELINKIFLNYSIKTIEGAGHWIQAEKPKEFIYLVREFLN